MTDLRTLRIAFTACWAWDDRIPAEAKQHLLAAQDILREAAMNGAPVHDDAAGPCAHCDGKGHRYTRDCSGRVQSVQLCPICLGSGSAISPLSTNTQPRQVASSAGATSAIEHLGKVLQFFAELHVDDRCRAFDEALAFYNAQRPDAQVTPEPGYELRLVQKTPLDEAINKFSPSSAGATDAAERNQIRQEAVDLVDGIFGHTVEFSSQPKVHRASYDAAEKTLLARRNHAGATDAAGGTERERIAREIKRMLGDDFLSMHSISVPLCPTEWEVVLDALRAHSVVGHGADAGVSKVRPSGEPGSYQRGYDNGWNDALEASARREREAVAECERLRDALRTAQASLATMIAPDAIRQTTVQHAWAQAVEAEQKARAALPEQQP